VLALCSVQPVLADGSSVQPNAPKPVQARVADPYKRLFRQPTIEQTARAQQRADQATPRPVCGMTLIPADPRIDPQILIAPRTDATHYTMRVIPPAICK